MRNVTYITRIVAHLGVLATVCTGVEMEAFTTGHRVRLGWTARRTRRHDDPLPRLDIRG